MKPPFVLAYHGIGEVSRSLDPHNLFVDEERFRWQISKILQRGYRVVRLAEFARGLHERRSLRGTCAITFDDGSVDNVELLPRVAAEFRVPVTVFACPGLLGLPHPFLAPNAGLRLMNADELKALGGMELFEIGSHTTFHGDLSTASEEDAYREMLSSKRALEEIVGRHVPTFAYPRCAYSSHCPRAAERAGYVAAVTCGARGGLRPFELRRESIDSLDRAATFFLKSRGLFLPLWASPPGRILRWLARPARHRPPA